MFWNTVLLSDAAPKPGCEWGFGSKRPQAPVRRLVPSRPMKQEATGFDGCRAPARSCCASPNKTFWVHLYFEVCRSQATGEPSGQSWLTGGGGGVVTQQREPLSPPCTPTPSTVQQNHLCSAPYLARQAHRLTQGEEDLPGTSQ